MGYRNFILFLLLAGLVGLSGCSDEVDARQGEERGYRGGADDLLEKQAAATHQEQLRKRLIMVQSDR